jgi:Domain of unknown function (DUF4381)
MTNTASNAPLNKLHDYYQPAPPAWTPQTIGWYVLFAAVALLLLWFAIYVIRRWFANRYRSEALRELVIATPDQFSALLKRTALAAWPREKVASLSGDAWLQFLGNAAATESFRSAPGNRIEELALFGNAASVEDEQTLRTIAAEWIRRHRVQA